MRVVGITLGILIILTGYAFSIADDTQPRGLKAVAGDGAVYLSWSKPKKEAKGYFVYRAVPERNYQKVNSNPLEETFYEDTDVVNGQFYWYTVTAIDKEGNESTQSENIGITPDISDSPLSGY